MPVETSTIEQLNSGIGKFSINYPVILIRCNECIITGLTTVVSLVDGSFTQERSSTENKMAGQIGVGLRRSVRVEV